ncbi:MAG: TlpA disulfide reductase family protein [Methylococcus sp.]|jgi:thiol-disulfide isomerase/thioredoxin
MTMRSGMVYGILLWGFISQALADGGVGVKAPSCTLSKIGGGGEKTLEAYQGKVIYVDFWASWCGPCAQSFPFMNKLQKELGSKGLSIVGVNLDEKAGDAMGFLNQTPAHFELVADAGGKCAHELGVKAMPSSYLIDRQGVLRFIHLGFKPTEAQALRDEVEALLDERSPVK